ncbi:hypothetical protein TorRG33x02_021340, partial [Trema orientale]
CIGIFFLAVRSLSALKWPEKSPESKKTRDFMSSAGSKTLAGLGFSGLVV